MSSIADGSDSPRHQEARALVAEFVEKVEVHFEDAIDALVAAHPELEGAVEEHVEQLCGPGLDRGASPSCVPGPELPLEPIGPYQPLSEIGRGGQGVVYLAEDRRLDRRVALKILMGFGPLSEKLIDRFRREAEVTSRLDHPGICTVYEAGAHAGIPYIAMRYVEGQTLAQLMPATTGPLALDHVEIVGIFAKVARALHAAHEAGVVHRDVKPANILITAGSHDPVMLDFGLASEEVDDLALTRTGDFLGTPAYMSPERLMSSRRDVDRRTDVFSLGVTLFECLTLRRPFQAPTREALYRAIEFKDPPDLRKLNPAVSPDLKVVIEKALEKDPDRRYPTALAFAEDLACTLARKPIAARPVGMPGRLARAVRRRPARAALVAALVFGLPVVTLLGGYVWAKQPQIAAAREQAVDDEVEGRLESGYDQLAQGDLERAIASFDAALALRPSSREAVGGQALALGALRRGREADAREAEVREPSSAVDSFLAGERLLQMCKVDPDPKRCREAFALLKTAVTTAPEARRLFHFGLARAAGQLDDVRYCEPVAHALLVLWPASSDAIRWATFALRNVEPAATVAICARALRAVEGVNARRVALSWLEALTAAWERAVESGGMTVAEQVTGLRALKEAHGFAAGWSRVDNTLARLTPQASPK